MEYEAHLNPSEFNLDQVVLTQRMFYTYKYMSYVSVLHTMYFYVCICTSWEYELCLLQALSSIE